MAEVTERCGAGAGAGLVEVRVVLVVIGAPCLVVPTVPLGFTSPVVVRFLIASSRSLFFKASMSLNASFLAAARDASPVPTGLVTGGSGVGCALCLLNLSPVPEVAVGAPIRSSEESDFLPPPRILELAFWRISSSVCVLRVSATFLN